MKTKNWTAKTNFEALLNEVYNSEYEYKWRYLIFKYCSRYQDEYYFDCLENAFVFLEEEFENKNIRTLLPKELKEIKVEVIKDYYE